MALADQEQHTDLGTDENRNKRDTSFVRPWWNKNDQCAFGVALANRDQHIEIEWPWQEKNAQSPFGVALASPNACPRKCMQKYTFAKQVRGKAKGGSTR